MLQAWCYRHDVERREPVDAGALARAIDPKRSLLWVDCDNPSDGEIESIVDQLEISHIAADDLRHGGQRTKLEHYRDHFHVAIHDCQLDGDRLVTREIDVVFGDGWLLSVRQPGDKPDDPSPFDVAPAARRFDIERLSEDANEEGFLLWALMDVVVDGYFDVSDRVDDRLDDIEEIVFERDTREGIPREVFDLRRALVRFRRAVAPLREVVAELLRKEADCLGEVALVHMQDVYDHVLRVTDLIESQRDLLTGLLEADLAVVSNRMNQVMKRMTSWGAIILGSTLIAGIYGMNFQHMPELTWYWGYPVALGSMVALTVTLYWWFKRRDWL